MTQFPVTETPEDSVESAAKPAPGRRFGPVPFPRDNRPMGIAIKAHLLKPVAKS